MKNKEKLKDLRLKSRSDLREEKVALMKSHFNMRMQKGTSELRKNHNFKIIRRDISRINTILSEKILQGS